MLGDVVAQSPDLAKGKAWDMKRTAKMGAFGMCFHGPMGHYWYGFLDRTIMVKAPTSAAAVATKTIIDQVTCAPVFTAVFFSAMKAMDGKSNEIKQEVQDKLWPTMKVNWTVWPLAHIINFRFVPSSQRILYINTIQIGYNAFLSFSAASPSSKEGAPPAKE